MDPISPRAQHILRFSGVHKQVLQELENHSLQAHSKVLFGRDSGVDMFVKRNPNDHKGEVEIAADKEQSLYFASGFIRNLYRQITGKDIKPSIEKMVRNPEPTGDLFKRTIVERHN